MLISRLLLTSLISITATAGLSAEVLSIPEIQGDGLSSPHVRKLVRTTGLVTHVARNSFYMYDPVGDGSDTTSDAIFVRRPDHGLTVGDLVTVEGQVDERPPRGNNMYPVTSIRNAVVDVVSQGNDVVPVVLGALGRLPPTETIFPPFAEDDPRVSGMVFFESLEGALVRIEQPIVVGPTNRFGELFVVAERGRQATGMNSLGGISLTPGDANPEIIQIQLKGSLADDPTFQVGVGDAFEFLQGVMSYDRGLYELVLTEAGELIQNPSLAHSIVLSEFGPSQLTIASYNVENLDPKKEDLALVPNRDAIDDDIADEKFAGIARHIVAGLGSPDIVALQEVQDGDGAEFSNEVSANLTLQTLVNAIEESGGPLYEFASLDPEDDRVGGQPGGNIQAAYLFNPARVSLDPTSLSAIQAPAFVQTRLPLFANFGFRGETVSLINVHMSSKGGSDPLYGTVQPPRDRSVQQRTSQSRAVRERVRENFGDGGMTTIVLGDFNSYWFEQPMLLLSGGTPEGQNLALDKPPAERISYTFQGNSQALDHVIAYLGDGHSAELRTLHVNSVHPHSERVSDHDPKLVILSFD